MRAIFLLALLSPARKNMLAPEVTETGVAVARSGKTGRYYAVQMFGRPRVNGRSGR